MNGRKEVPPVSLGTHSARGLVYLFAGSTAAKVISFATQIALLYLLGPNDFGVVFLAYTITAFIQVIEQAGVGDVLVRRRRFRIWSIPGFWFSLALGVLSCLLIALSAPIASAILGKSALEREQLFWVLLILSTSSLANALSVVPRAQLSRELRFGVLAAVNVGYLTLQKILTVIFAAMSFGPYSFVMPTPIAGLLTTAFLWWWVRPAWSVRPHLKRWRFLFGDSTLLLIAEFGRAIIDQSDYFLIGLFRTAVQVGIYAVGFLFSVQMLQLLMVNMTSILFPAFTKLNNHPLQQFQGFLKAQRILAMLGVSGCLLQSAVAAPFAHLVFPGKWDASVIVMQILSLGMATRMVSGASFAMLKSQGRFTTILINRWCFVAIQVIAISIVLAFGGDVASVATIVSIIASFIGPVTFYSAIQPYGAGWAEVAEVLIRPLVCGVLSVGPAWLIALKMEAMGIGSFWQLVETVIVSAVLNVLLVWLWMRPVWDDFWSRMRRMLPQRVIA